MNILLIHQNFPGQYKHLGPALAARGDTVVALTPKVKEPTTWNGVQVVPYPIRRGTTKGVHPWLADFETKLIRAEACRAGAMDLALRGFQPDVILGHHGWGEPMLLKDVWPDARLGLYCELYHRASYPQMGFDPEFPSKDPAEDAIRIRLRNINNRLHDDIMDAGISPTHFQADTFPEAMRKRIEVIHDGIDTEMLQPDPGARLDLGKGLVLTREDEVITFINRNLEPYRGYHVFMRALPEILKRRPKAHVVLLGGDEVSYGPKAPGGQSWKQMFIDEVRGRIPTPSWKRVHFLGRVPYDRFRAVVGVSRAHVYLTYPFVLSWSLLEAMSSGAAILASDTAPVQEVLTEGETGLMVDFFDRAALVDRLCVLLEDEGLRQRLGANARAFARAHYDLRQVCLPRQLDWVDRLAALPSRRPDPE